MASQPEAVKFPFPPSPVPYDTGPELRALAAQRPVTRVELPDGSAAWLVTGFDEVRDADRPAFLPCSRAQKTHVAFGAGAHHCLGAQLARMELQEAFRGLLTTLPGLRMAVPLSDIEFRAGQAVASMRVLPVTWDDPEPT
jgi:Cytochrome P450